MTKDVLWKKIVHWYQEYHKWKKEASQTVLYRAWNFWQNLFLAFFAVIPLFVYLCQTIPFSYEVNDDATIAQILDGSYTGNPDAHSIFIKYPLSWIIKRLYEKNPAWMIGKENYQNINWYVGVIVILEIFALVIVLFRLLNFFAYNRLLLCVLFDLGVVVFWLPCFFNMTFSTAAAFLGCMGILFLGLERKEEAWRPWNIILLGVLLISCWCLREPCLWMVLPFLGIEFLLKYHISFFQSPKPWFAGTFLVLLLVSAVVFNGRMYDGREWKTYLQYNRDRAYLQDYVGFPPYEGNEEFYHSVGMNENERDAMAGYTYCLVDDFQRDWVEKTWLYVKNKEKKLPLSIKMEKSVVKAERYLLRSESAPVTLKKASFYFCLCVVPIFLITLLFYWKGKIKSHIKNLCSIILMGGVLAFEWIYLAMNGRFPQRVEETIRLLTLCVGFLLVCKSLQFWTKNRWIHLPFLLQFLIVVLICRSGVIMDNVEAIKGEQNYNLMYASEKAEIVSYCGKHKENNYILDTRSFTKMSTPSDNLHQGNWFMSGSWIAYSPLYQEKLEKAGTSTLGTKFLLQDHVYIITKGKKNLSKWMGLEKEKRAESVIVDEIMTSNHNFYMVYKITGITAEK